MATAKPIYAPLPARAVVDRNLSERHLRTLAVVAAHDRLNKNGVGCWASHARLAEMVGCDYSRLSKNLKELGELGYLERVEHPLNRRLRVYRVLYTDADAATMNSFKVGDSCPNGQVSGGTTVGQMGQTKRTIVAHPKTEVPEIAKEPVLNIFRETGNRTVRESALEEEGASTFTLGALHPRELATMCERLGYSLPEFQALPAHIIALVDEAAAEGELTYEMLARAFDRAAA